MQRINLIPEEVGIKPKVQFKSKVLIRNVAFLPLIVVFFCFIDALPQFIKIHRFQKELKIAKEKLASTRRKLENVAANEGSLRSQIDEWKQKVQLLQEQKSSFDKELEGAIEWSSVLIELSRIVPKKTWLNRILLNKGILTIEGFALSNMEVSEFLENLEASPIFADAEFRSTELKELEERKKNIVKFQLIGRLY